MELLAEVVGLGVGSVIAIQEALALENLNLAEESRFFAHARPYCRPKDRHIRNHNAWQEYVEGPGRALAE